MKLLKGFCGYNEKMNSHMQYLPKTIEELAYAQEDGIGRPKIEKIETDYKQQT